MLFSGTLLSASLATVIASRAPGRRRREVSDPPTIHLQRLVSHLDNSYVTSWALPVDVKAENAQTQSVRLLFDTGSPETWVRSSLDPVPRRYDETVYQVSASVRQHMDACALSTMQYEMGSVDIKSFEATLVIEGSEVSGLTIGATTRTKGDFEISPATQIADGFIGMAPTVAAANIVKQLGKGTESSQLLFDGLRGIATIGTFDDPAFTWMDVVQGDPHRPETIRWLVDDKLFDTGFSVVQMDAERVEKFFETYPEGHWMQDDGFYIVDCNIANHLAETNEEQRPTLSIDFGAKGFDLDAEVLVGAYSDEYTPTDDVEYWCASELQAWQEDAVSPMPTILGLAWMKKYDVVFDTNPGRQKIGIRHRAGE